MKKLLLTTLLSLSVFLLIAQPSIEWQKTFGGSGDEQAYSIQQTNDGGYIIAGWSSSIDGDLSGNAGASDYWIVKLNNDNTIEWQKTLGGSNFDYAHSIQQTTDGGYIIAGNSRSTGGDVTGNNGSFDSWIVKLDSTGDLVWQNSLGGTEWDATNIVQQTIDGGYVFAGYTDSSDGDISGNNGERDFWLVKLDNSGDLAWQKCLGGTNEELAFSMQLTADGGFVLAGDSKSSNGDVSNNQGLSDYWIVKTDNTRTIEWEKTYGGSDQDIARSIQQTTDGGYIVAGYSKSSDGDVTNNYGVFDYWILKLNNIGDLEWEKTYGGSDNDTPLAVQQTTDGGYVVIGYAASLDGDVTDNHGGGDFWLIKLNNTGDLLWNKALGGSADDTPFSIQQTNDNGFIVVGYSYSTDGDVTDLQGNADLWVVKLTGDPVSIDEVAEAALLNIYPNPTKGEINLTVEIQFIGKNYSIYNSLGKIVSNGIVEAEHTLISLESLSSGVYFIQIEGFNNIVSNRFIVK